MSSSDHTDCESIEDEEQEGDSCGDADFSSAGSPPQSRLLVPCNASILRSVRSAVATPPPHLLTCRVLCHPTFEAFYAAVAIHLNLETPEMQLRREEGFSANTGEYFYTDYLQSPGRRVYNCLSPASHNVFGCFHLQAPPPIMSPCVVPSTYEEYPMIDEAEIPGDGPHSAGLMDLRPLDMSAPQCPAPPVLACLVGVGALPRYTAAELDAVCGLLCLSSAVPSPSAH